jgi:SHAQKYF class myb-like DNA-binding protein
MTGPYNKRTVQTTTLNEIPSTLEPKVEIGPKDHFFRPYDLNSTIIISFQIQSAKFFPDRIEKPKKIETITTMPKVSLKPYPCEYSQSIKEEFLISKSKGKKNFKFLTQKVGEWSKEEHELFLKGYEKYNKNWSHIARDFVKSRTRQQVRNHAVKFFLKEPKL